MNLFLHSDVLAISWNVCAPYKNDACLFLNPALLCNPALIATNKGGYIVHHLSVCGKPGSRGFLFFCELCLRYVSLKLQYCINANVKRSGCDFVPSD